MKEENAVLPILTGLVLAMVASHIMTWNHPTPVIAESVLLFASVGFILAGIFSYCSMTAKSTKSTARQLLELED